MQKYASDLQYKTIYEALPTQNDTPVYYDKTEIEIPFIHDFPYLHYHDRYEFGICSEGNGLFLCDGAYYSVSAGDLIFVPANSRHYSRSLSENEPFICRFIYVNPSLIDSVLKNSAEYLRDIKIPAVISASEHPRLTVLFSEISKLCKNGCKNMELKIALRIATFFLDAESTFPSAIKTASDEIAPNISVENEAQKIAQFISLHYAESQSAGELARLVHISESQLRRQFIAMYGMPPIAYRNHLRAGIAAELLVRSKLSVFEIGGQVGYNSASDFYRIFTKRYGISPSDYRKLKKI